MIDVWTSFDFLKIISDFQIHDFLVSVSKRRHCGSFFVYSLILEFLVVRGTACSMEKVRTCWNRMLRISSEKVTQSPVVINWRIKLLPVVQHGETCQESLLPKGV